MFPPRLNYLTSIRSTLIIIYLWILTLNTLRQTNYLVTSYEVIIPPTIIGFFRYTFNLFNSPYKLQTMYFLVVRN